MGATTWNMKMTIVALALAVALASASVSPDAVVPEVEGTAQEADLEQAGVPHVGCHCKDSNGIYGGSNYRKYWCFKTDGHGHWAEDAIHFDDETPEWQGGQCGETEYCDNSVPWTGKINHDTSAPLLCKTGCQTDDECKGGVCHNGPTDVSPYRCGGGVTKTGCQTDDECKNRGEGVCHNGPTDPYPYRCSGGVTKTGCQTDDECKNRGEGVCHNGPTDPYPYQCHA